MYRKEKVRSGYKKLVTTIGEVNQVRGVFVGRKS
jgi:hypothetical protein